MNPRYPLRSQRSTIPSIEPMLPGSLAESPLTEPDTHNKTPTPSPIARSFSRIGDSMLRPVRSYSDVVRMRSESPQPRTGGRSASVDSTTNSYCEQTNVLHELNDEPRENPFVTTSESSAESENRTSWRTIKKHPSKSRKTTKARPKKISLPKPDLVKEAENQLTEEDKQCIYNRKHAEEVAHDDEHTSSSHEEGPSKGKGVDPRNWGNVDLDEPELDPEAQRDALATWAKSKTWANERTGQQTESDSEQNGPTFSVPTEQQIMKYYEQKIRLLEERLKKAEVPTRPSRNKPTVRITKRSTNHHPVREMVERVTGWSSKKQGRRETPPAMDAAAQIAPKSYLGRAFNKINVRKGKETIPSYLLESESTETSSEQSSDARSTTTTASSESKGSPSSSSDESSGKASKNRHKNNKRKTKKKTTLKPIPPREYDGSVDLRAFHRFITEGTAYVEDGNVPRKRQVFILSHYLQGKAHEFYLRQVSDQPGKWRIKEFFTELFDYCFPLDFRTKQRKKLYRCYQGDKRVRDYLSELNELWMTIGDTLEREKVVKFWFGLNNNIQNELYKMHLNPEVSTLHEVQQTAEIIELAESAVTNGKSHDEGSKSTKRGTKDPKGRQQNQPGGENTHQGQCPKRTNVPSGRRDRPPGVPNYAVHIETPQRDEDDGTELISEIPLCGIVLGYDDPKQSIQRTWGIVDEPLGDPTARWVEQVLRQSVPYPGDDLTNDETFSSERFLIYRVSETHHVIMDQGSHLREDIEIPSSLLAKPEFFVSDWYRRVPTGDSIPDRVVSLLNAETQFPGEPGKDRFQCQRLHQGTEITYKVYDQELNFCVEACESLFHNEKLSLTHWYARQLLKGYQQLNKLMLRKELEWENNHFRLLEAGELSPLDCALEDVVHQLFAIPGMRFEQTMHQYRLVELNGQQVALGKYPAIQRNAAVTRDFRRLIPKPVVVMAHINGCPIRVLIDTGSLADFMSSTLADQLKIKHIQLEKPLTIQLAVQGSRSKVNFGAKAQFAYQRIKEERFFDIINLQNYDLILGTPFLFQHQVSNTKKLSSPLPDIDGILRRVARKRYRSIIDGQDAYEQIQIIPEHVERSTVTTPDGNMILGCVIDDEGICMDPAKVDKILAWKTPTNRDALRSFLGAVGFLADDIYNVRVPRG
ncbi:uncharacterized protein EDB93DRAFT_1102748 [Suillus bovinus]|uniref:uncharacterized protein n=1 Tax=Suillus bovinus TaxID=48563 RepID=UPI001B8716CA|nr:uncharacterized protein EDB93DRAFT_1102748 [Suillus bovinus]KAG2152977.1 hypothetical protein EDB93DRAFT_1102748 [Suillus bovinus]